jgi:hypothetical protein
MASNPAIGPHRRAELLESIRASQRRNAERRVRVLRHAENLGRIAEKLRAHGR